MDVLVQAKLFHLQTYAARLAAQLPGVPTGNGRELLLRSVSEWREEGRGVKKRMKRLGGAVLLVGATAAVWVANALGGYPNPCAHYNPLCAHPPHGGLVQVK